MGIAYNYKVAFFCITTKTMMHVGAGGENFWIIDKLIQRDETTNLPCINSTSLKGALREFMRDYLSSDGNKINGKSWATILFQIFGNDRSDIEKKEVESILKEVAKDLNIDANKWKDIDIAGDFRILPAELLSIPTLKEDKIQHIISCNWIKDNLQDKLDLFSCELANGNTIDKIVKADEYLSEIDFSEKVDDYNLPVIARNHLEDGTSTNLWYEQVLPRATKMIFPVVYNDEELFEIFKEAITSYPIQIGANASVGYGFCKIDFIETTLKNKL